MYVNKNTVFDFCFKQKHKFMCILWFVQFTNEQCAI